MSLDIGIDPDTACAGVDGGATWYSTSGAYCCVFTSQSFQHPCYWLWGTNGSFKTAHPSVSSLWPCNAIWWHKCWWTLVQVMACCLFGTKLLPEPMLTYCQLDRSECINFSEVLNQNNTKLFFHINSYENVCKLLAILSLFRHQCVVTLRLRQNGWHLAGNISKCNHLNKNNYILIKISYKFLPRGPIDNKPVLV